MLLHDPLNALRIAGKKANVKFLRPFTGPHVIVKRHDNNNVTIRLAGKRGKRATLRVHVDRIKHYNKDFDGDFSTQHRGKVSDDETASRKNEMHPSSEEEVNDSEDDMDEESLHGPLSFAPANTAHSLPASHTPPSTPPPVHVQTTPPAPTAINAPSNTPTVNSPAQRATGARPKKPTSAYKKMKQRVERMVRPRRKEQAESSQPAAEPSPANLPFAGRLRYKSGNPNRQVPVVHPTKKETEQAVAYRRPQPAPQPSPADLHPEDQPLPDDVETEDAEELNVEETEETTE